MKITLNIPDDSLYGLRTHIASHGEFVPNTITGRQEYRPFFPSVDAYLIHAIGEQIKQFNIAHPRTDGAEAVKLAEIERLKAELAEAQSPTIQVEAE